MLIFAALASLALEVLLRDAAVAPSPDTNIMCCFRFVEHAAGLMAKGMSETEAIQEVRSSVVHDACFPEQR